MWESIFLLGLLVLLFCVFYQEWKKSSLKASLARTIVLPIVLLIAFFCMLHLSVRVLRFFISNKAGAIATAHKIGATTLREDAAALQERFKTEKYYRVPKEMWPASFKAFSPVAVRYGTNTFTILRFKLCDLEDSIVVIPAGDNSKLPVGKMGENTPFPSFVEEIDDGIYWDSCE